MTVSPLAVHEVGPNNAAMRSSWTAAIVCVTAASCAPSTTVDPDLLSGFPRYEAQRRALCDRSAHDPARNNAVTAAFCVDGGPHIDSFSSLLQALDLDLDAAESPAFTLVAHSAAIGSRSVTALNPGSVIVSLPARPSDLNGAPGKLRSDGNIVALAFARGDQMVEIAVTPNADVEGEGGTTAFYLLRYERACGDANACSPGDKLMETTEHEWQRWSLYDDVDLKNTVLDCLECHQPSGPRGPRIYRMQEPENPWTHWEAAFTLGGRALLDDTLAAHRGANTIAGVPIERVEQTNPVCVEDLVRFSRSVQPNLMNTPVVENEVEASDPAQPRDDSKPGASPSWDPVYAAAVEGKAIPPPYHDVKVTDPEKLRIATKAMNDFRSGKVKTLDDVRDVFAEHALAGMSHRPKEGLDGRGILVHACAQCHNDRLDQTLSRARFDALHLDDMSDTEKQTAIVRLQLPEDDRRHMPPKLFRTLSDDELQRAIDALK